MRTRTRPSPSAAAWLTAIAAAVAATGIAGPAAAAADVGDFRSKLERWVETRQILSEEQADWAVDRETLRASRDLLQQQKADLQQQIDELTASSTVADEQRNELLLQRGELQRASRSLEDSIRQLELEVLALVPRLPEPLRRKLDLLIVQIPEDDQGDMPALGQRLMNVLGILAQTEKWNSTATFVGETRAVDGDQKVQVRTLYWGLSHAVYVDAQGRTAGVGHPGPQGWEFSNDPALARAAKKLLDIHEGNVDVIEFVELPVEIR